MFQKFRRTYQTLNRIEISSSALKNNYQYFLKTQKHALVAPVLKSNAYGHGLTAISSFIDQELKVPFIVVDSLFEAYELEKANVKTPVLIIGYTLPANFSIRKNLTKFRFPVYDEETLAVLNKHQPGAKVHLKVDSGMNRLGIKPKDTPHFIQLFKKYNQIELEGIYTHLSQSDDPSKNSFTNQQVATFKDVIRQFERSGFRFKWKHLAATAGSRGVQDKECNLIRLGLGFYGISPFKEQTAVHQELQHELQPAMKLISHLAQIKQVEQGSEISYGGTYVAKTPLTIGIIPIGYYDGIDRRLSNKGTVRVRGEECPIVGSVCMNVTIIDLTNIKNPKVGDEVVVFSDEISHANTIEESAKLCDTIPYTLLVNLSETTKRVIVE